MTAFVPTQEQNACVNASKVGTKLKIDAGAGAAKTSTLILMAEQENARSLYLAFNRAMADEARGRFPSWVTVKTTHSLAYGQCGAQLAHKLKRPQGAYQNVCGTGTEIANYFKLKDMEVEDTAIPRAALGNAVKETLNHFEFSASEVIEAKHVSFTAAKGVLKKPGFDSGEYSRTVLSAARKLWRLRCDEDSNILATHDTYMKLYQLSKPDLSAYKVIYLDEAQDTNACVMDIFLSQTKCKLIAVGDRYQQIYGWRGSVNAMAHLPFERKLLTKSFRFGQAVADVANILLGKSPEEELVGWEKLDTVVYEQPPKNTPESVMRLYRMNSTLILDAVDLLVEGKVINLEIDTKNFALLLKSADALIRQDKRNIKHEDIVPYAKWQDLVDEAKESQGELQRVVRLVEDGKHLEVIEVLENHVNVDFPEITMTTAHKSKGREADHVILMDDYPSGYNKDGEWVGFEDGERNLLYVALTRAKKSLTLNTSLIDMLREYSSYE